MEDLHMKQKIALLVYPYFSMQEISSICGLFRWHYDTETVVFATTMEPVMAEEGILFQPHHSVDEFVKEEYDCLILPGCSDFRIGIQDEKLTEFLIQFKEETDFVIGAICGGPLFLAKAHLLDDRHFTNSLFVEMNERFSFIHEENFEYAPVVEDGNIITAVGSAFNEFAVAVARKLGYECEDHIYQGIPKHWKKEDFIFHLDEEGLQEMEETYREFMRDSIG